MQQHQMTENSGINAHRNISDSDLPAWCQTDNANMPERHAVTAPGTRDDILNLHPFIHPSYNMRINAAVPSDQCRFTAGDTHDIRGPRGAPGSSSCGLSHAWRHRLRMTVIILSTALEVLGLTYPCSKINSFELLLYLCITMISCCRNER